MVEVNIVRRCFDLNSLKKELKIFLIPYKFNAKMREAYSTNKFCALHVLLEKN